MSDDGYGGADGQCSAFLVADNIVATNSHCIPDSLKSEFYTPDCSKHMAIRFHPKDGKKEIFKCEEMLIYSDLENDVAKRDFAFFKIASTGRKPFAIHKGGIKDHQRLELRRVSPLSYTFGGRSSTLRCRNVLNSYVNSQATSPWFSRGAAVGCQIVKGNSGSPIVDAKTGKVVGIGQAYWSDKYRKEIAKNLKEDGLSYTKVPDHTLFTNLSCVKDPVTKTRNNRLCDMALNVGLGQCLNMNLEDASSQIRRKLETWSRELDDDFVYEIYESVDTVSSGFSRTQNSTISFSADPICVKESARAIPYFSEGPSVKRRSVPGAIEFNVMWDTDQDLKLNTSRSLKLKKTDVKKADLTFVYDDQKNLWTGFKSLHTGRYGSNREKKALDLPTCTRAMLSEGHVYVESELTQDQRDKSEICSKLEVL